MKLLIVAAMTGLALVVAVGGVPGIIASRAGYEIGAMMSACDQKPKNSSTSKTHDLDEEAEDWGIFCEKSPTWSLTNVATPSLDGKSLRCSITGGAAYGNVHCYRNLRPEPEASVFKLTMPFYFTPATSCNNEGNDSIVQALEFSMSKWQQAQRYEFALQWLDVGDGAPQWRYWDPHRAEAERWVPLRPVITQCLAAEEWHTLTLEGEIINDQVYYRRFVIDQQSHNLNITVPPASTPGESDRLAVAVQLDGNFEEAPYNVFIDQVSLVTEPALRVTKQASPSPVQDGAPLTHMLRVTNAGNVTLTAAITDILPSQVTPTGVLNWKGVTIEPRGTWTEQVVVTVKQGYTGSLTNKVEVTTKETKSSKWAKNRSYCTTCAEEDNINIPLFTDHRVRYFRVVATHPEYNVGVDNCAADFSGCNSGASIGTVQAANCQTLLDDGINVIKVCTEPGWWLGVDNTMQVRVDNQIMSGHRLIWHRKIQDEASWPEFMVLYQDGNMRLKPHPPSGRADVCFGSSVIIGPAPPATRPYVEIEKVLIDPVTLSMDILYRNGEGAWLKLSVDRNQAVAEVKVGYEASQPFATLRSMYVSEGKADVDHIETAEGAFSFLSGSPAAWTTAWTVLEGPWWFFHRQVRSEHNTSAPDILIEVEEGPSGVARATICVNHCLTHLPIIVKAH